MSSISFVSVNIERDKHLERVSEFLTKRMPDVVCMQELNESNVAHFEHILGAKSYFVPMMRYPYPDGHRSQGMGIFSRLPIREEGAFQYAGNEGPLADFDERTPAFQYATEKFLIARVLVEKDGEQFALATTHFLWTPDGQADDFQRTGVQALLKQVHELGELVLCGDFNAPRGGEIFSAIAAALTDNIPQHYTTSIDGTFHRSGPLPYMVDGLFTTPAYSALDVSLVPGVSDHCAIVATVAKHH